MKISDFKTEEQLAKMKVQEIKSHVKEFNQHFAIRGYSKLPKSQLISLVLTAQDRIRNANKETAKSKPISKKQDPTKRLQREMELKKMKKSQLLEMVLPSDKNKTKAEIIQLILKQAN